MVAYDPFSVEAMSDPFPLYRRLRDEAPVHWLPQYDTWVLSRFADVWEALQDRGELSVVEGPVFARERLLVHNNGSPEPGPARPVRSFATLDPPAHTALRQLMAPNFTPRACSELQEEVERLVGTQLDRLEDRDRFDVVADYAGPVAAAATLLFLGMSIDDAERVQCLIARATRRQPGTPGASSPEAMAAHAELHALVVEHVRARRTTAGDAETVTERLLRADTALDDAEVADQVLTLLLGGVETLPKIVAGGVLQLARHPQQRRALRADPSLARGAFEEMVRLEGVLQSVGRTVTRDVTIAGVSMRPGQRVLLLLQSANRDEREFAEPERFRLDRPLPRHVGFGHGTHFCIGVHAARLQGVALVRQLLERMPNFEVDVSAAERPPSEFQIGWTKMPLVRRRGAGSGC